MEKGLQKIVDLGNFWEEKTAFPFPLAALLAKEILMKK